MKRAIIPLIALLFALAGVGVVANAAYYPSSSMATTASTAKGEVPHKLTGYAGKIIAVKPPGDWAKGGGSVDTSRPPSPRLPLVLPVFGTDVNIAASNETFMASNPTNPLNFLTGSNAVARAVSTNGGTSWTVTAPSGIGDPVGVFDNVNNAYFGQLSTGTCPDPAVVSRSSDGGVTWGSQVTALSDASPTDHFIDKPWMAADIYPSSPFYGRIYVTGSSFYAPGCNLSAYINNREVIAFSTNQGTTWSSPVTLSDASHDQDQFTNPVVASNGTLYVGYQYQNCTYNCTSSIPMVQLITKSTNGGVTFSPSITITGPMSPTGSFVGGYQYLYASSTATGFRHNDQAIIGVSPTNPQHVYAVWTDGRFESSFTYQSVVGQHADIVFTRSTDGGSTWTPVVKINDDNVQGKDQFFPWMAVGSDGTIHVTWMDRREAAVNGFPYREYYTQSTDEGQTWSANQPVGDVTNTPSTFIGDYAGLAVNGNNSRVLPVWTDQRSGQRIFTDPGLIGGGGTPTPTVLATSTPTPACGPAAWSAGPTMTPGRYTIQGAVGTDGNVYVETGLDAASTPLPAQMARYNPGTNSWSNVAAPPIAVGEYSMAAANGKVYVAGGFLGGTAITSTLQIYDIASNTWTYGASMPASVEAAAGAIFNGKFYVVGGDDFNLAVRSTYIYDIATNTWTTGPQIPDTNGRTNTYGTTSGGKVYVFGGVYIQGGTNFTIDTLISYDPGTNSWTTLASANTGGKGNYAGVSPYGAGKLFVTDGGDGNFTAVATTHIYDIATNTWTAGPTMLGARLGHAQATLPDGRVFVYSGLVVGGLSPQVTETSELLSGSSCGSATPSPTQGTGGTPTATPTCSAQAASWTDVTHVPVNKGRALGVNYNNSIYVFGGRPDNTTYTQDVYRYDLLTDSWTLLAQQLPDAMTSNMGGGLLTFPEGQRIFVVGGSGTGSVATGRTLAFNPADGSFTAKTTWPAPTVHLPGGWAVHNNKLYVFGGYIPNVDMTTDIWIYDPTTNAWTQSAVNLSLARGYIATEAMPDGLIYLAGGSQYNGGLLGDETIFEKYNPSTDTITTGPPMTIARSNDHGFNVGGKFFVPTGGFTLSTTDVEVYDPVANSWSAGPPTLFPVRNYAKGYGLNGSIHVIGGTADSGGATYYPYNQKYSPAAACGTPTVGPSATNTPSRTPTNTSTLVPTNTATTPPQLGTSTSTRTSTPTSTTIPVVGTDTPTPTLTSTACPIQFSDVPNPSTFYAFIRCLACRGIVNGYSDGTFRPNNNVTRGQLSKIVSNSAGFNDPQTVQMFEDVPVGSTFFDYIGRLASRGYISGYPCGGTGEPCNPPNNLPYFRTNNNATRGQITKIVSNAAGFVDPPAGQIFEDSPPGSTFYTYTNRLASRGVMQGYPCGGVGEPCNPPNNRPYFRPFNNATRGQTSKIVANTFFPDCETPNAVKR